MSWPASPSIRLAILILCCHGIGGRQPLHAAKRLNLDRLKPPLRSSPHAFVRTALGRIDLGQQRGPPSVGHKKSPTTVLCRPPFFNDAVARLYRLRTTVGHRSSAGMSASSGRVEGTNKARTANRPLWLGPFDTPDAATEAVRNTGLRLVIDGCKICRPDLGLKPMPKESPAEAGPSFVSVDSV
jgi:hypothetical protein